MVGTSVLSQNRKSNGLPRLRLLGAEPVLAFGLGNSSIGSSIARVRSETELPMFNREDVAVQIGYPLLTFLR